MPKTNICIGRYHTKVSRINTSADRIEDKMKIYNHCLLGDNGLINKKYEEVLYLLFYKHLPNKTELEKTEKIIKNTYKINYNIQFNLIKNNIEYFRNNPLNLVEINLLSLNCLEENQNINYISLFVQCLITSLNFFNIYMGRDFCLPLENLSIIENWLYIIGKDYKNKDLVSNFSRMLIAWMECYLASSSVAGMLSISARTDFISAVVSGFINCTGKKHTSARIECAKFLLSLKEDIEKSGVDKNNLECIKKIIKNKVQGRLDNNKLVYGFGHYFFKELDDDGYDPRIRVVRKAINTIFPDSFYLKITEMLVNMFRNGEFTRNGKEFKLPPNSDIFWTSFLLDFFKDYNFIPVEIMSLFTILTRIAGLIAHCDEQYCESDPIKVSEED